MLVGTALAVLLIVAGGGLWLGLRGGGPSTTGSGAGNGGPDPAGAVTSPSMSGSMSPSATPTNALSEAVMLANVGTHGLLPEDRCSETTPAHVHCERPAVGVYGADLSTYDSLDVLYDTYVRRARALAGGSFRSNVGDCTHDENGGEISWNHNYQHPRQFTLDQVRTGHLRDTQAAGRVFCRLRQGVLTIMWTQNDATMLGIVSGAPHSLVFQWWKAVHHNLAVQSPGMDMGN